MTLQQLQYIVALNKTRHFVQAADLCKVTQPTLSMMVQKLEEELDVQIFDRTKHPIEVTPIGEKIIIQAHITLSQADKIKEIISVEKDAIDGFVKIAIIPTVAPYLLPKFFSTMRTQYPSLSFTMTEMRTKTIEQSILTGDIDVAILSTPLNNPNILEIPLYYEEFLGYVSPNNPLHSMKELDAAKLPKEQLWVLEEGHCLRNQIFNFCTPDKNENIFIYEAGSIETLIKVVDENGGYTVIPELHINSLTEKQKQNLRKLVNPPPYREISLIIRDNFVREGQLNAIANAIKDIIPDYMLDSRLKKYSIKI